MSKGYRFYNCIRPSVFLITTFRSDDKSQIYYNTSPFSIPWLFHLAALQEYLSVWPKWKWTRSGLDIQKKKKDKVSLKIGGNDENDQPLNKVVTFRKKIPVRYRNFNINKHSTHFNFD